MTEPVIRPLAGEADYAACLELQRATWGDDFRELVPPAILMIAGRTGGIAAGAFDASGALVGFVFGVSGFRDGRPIHWSHMLAVRADQRDRGVGTALKAWQAERLRANGILSAMWTFDPLVARNAHLNLERLGARVVAYVRDAYGAGDRSTTDAVIGSDRLVVEWDLGGETPAGPQGLAAGAIAIPADIQRLKHDDPARAQRWRAETRAAFEAALAGGRRVSGFARTAEGGRYLLARP